MSCQFKFIYFNLTSVQKYKQNSDVISNEHNKKSSSIGRRLWEKVGEQKKNSLRDLFFHIG
jgi:hypothetical protein